MAIREGTIIILFPNEWHRYKPDKGTGWDEYWVGFKGNIADNLVTNHFLNPTAPCIQIGVQEKVVRLFDEILEKSKEDNSEERRGGKESVSTLRVRGTPN